MSPVDSDGILWTPAPFLASTRNSYCSPSWSDGTVKKFSVIVV